MSTDLHTLSGAYAIDALSPEEAASFARHLAECDTCREEVAEFQEAAAIMGASEAVRPPAALRARVLAAADREPQLPPVTRLDSRRPRRWTSRIVGAAAAVILVVGLGIGIGQLRDRGETPVATDPVAQVFGAADAHVKTFTTSDGKRVRVATSADEGSLAIDTSSLGRLSTKQVYQFWALRNGKATSIGLVSDTRQGKVTAIPTAGTTVAISVEPAGGSPQPTTAPIVQVNPSSI